MQLLDVLTCKSANKDVLLAKLQARMSRSFRFLLIFPSKYQVSLCLDTELLSKQCYSKIVSFTWMIFFTTKCFKDPVNNIFSLTIQIYLYTLRLPHRNDAESLLFWHHSYEVTLIFKKKDRINLFMFIFWQHTSITISENDTKINAW